MKLKFEINTDLKALRFNFHNACHFFGALLMAFFLGFRWSYGAWLAWEIGDGLKPWYYDYRFNFNQSRLLNTFRRECLYSDKFSLQDALVWDLAGALIGTGLRYFIPL